MNPEEVKISWMKWEGKLLADTYLVITVLSINEEKTAAQILNKGKLLVQWCAGDLQ